MASARLSTRCRPTRLLVRHFNRRRRRAFLYSSPPVTMVPAACSGNGSTASVDGIGITGWGETVYNVSVGGTDFEDTYNAAQTGGLPVSTYWNSTNGSTYGSAKSYIPEIPWNNSCAGYLLYHLRAPARPMVRLGFATRAGQLSTRRALAAAGPAAAPLERLALPTG